MYNYFDRYLNCIYSPTRAEVSTLCFNQKRICFDERDQKHLCLDQIRLKHICFDQCRRSKNISTKFDQGKTFRSSSIEELFRPRKKNISTMINRGKRFDRAFSRFFFEEKELTELIKTLLHTSLPILHLRLDRQVYSFVQGENGGMLSEIAQFFLTKNARVQTPTKYNKHLIEVCSVVDSSEIYSKSIKPLEGMIRYITRPNCAFSEL